MTPTISPALFSIFSRYARWYVARSFHAVRLARDAAAPTNALDRPLVIYLNHPSWWDPMIAVVLANHLWPGKKHYAPIDAVALDKYRFFRRLGFYPVEKNTRRGAAQFLRGSLEILEQPDAVLWITPQGTFADPRQRPTVLLPGLSHLARRAPHAAFAPLAIEYPFWQERFPESLCRLGPIVPEPTPEALQDAMQSTQDALAQSAIAHDASCFQQILGGRAGVSIVYDAWRRLRAFASGKSFSAGHGEPLA